MLVEPSLGVIAFPETKRTERAGLLVPKLLKRELNFY